MRCEGPGRVHVVEVEPPRGDGARVHVRSVGLCGSDQRLVSDAATAVTLGHEFAGVLDDGTPVAVQPTVACGACARCREGQDQVCTDALKYLYGITLDGGLADEVIVDPRCLVPLADEVDVATAGLVEPLAVVVHALNRVGAPAGGRLLVIGAGSIGLCTLAAALRFDLEIDVMARYERQQAAVEALGGSLSTGKGYDYVIDAVGTQAAMDLAVERARRGGRIVTVGKGNWHVELGNAVFLKELSVASSLFYGHHDGVRDFDAAAAVLAAQPALPDLLVTQRFSLDEAPDAFRVAADRASGAIKVQLHP